MVFLVGRLLWSFYVVGVFSQVSCNRLFFPEISKSDEVTSDITGFVNNHGYLLESYEATTKDGYILTIHRIPGKVKSENISGTKPPIFLMHGIVCTSFDWVVLGHNSMALMLAEAGYDVWIGNNRGNTYSRRHVRLDPDTDASFWEYSYNEIGMYDLPAMIDKVLELTGKEKLTYLGFSEGFTSLMVMGSQRPKYNKKIKTMHAFAPVTDMYKVKSPVLAILQTTIPVFGNILRMFKQTELMTNRYFAPLCRIVIDIPFIGASLVRFFVHGVGGSYEQLDLDFMKKIFVNFPGGVSLRQVEHYVQGSRTGHFRPFYEENETPQHDYDLHKVTVPIFLYYGANDYLVNNDILLDFIAPKLNIKKIYKISEPTFNHVDMIWGKNVTQLYRQALKNINENT